MSGAVALKSKPNYSDSSVTISFKRRQNNFSLHQEFKSIDRDIKIIEDKYVSPEIYIDEEDRKNREKLNLDHYILKTNKNIKNIDTNLELKSYQGKTYYYGLTEFIEFCNAWGNYITKIEKLYLDKMYLYAYKNGRIGELKEIDAIFNKYNFSRRLIQKSLNKSQIAQNFKRIYMHDIIESVKEKEYNKAIDKVIYYSNNIIEEYLKSDEKERNKLFMIK